MRFQSLLKLVLSKMTLVVPIKRKYIIFESYPEMGGSPWMIYSALKKMGYDKKYRFIWFVDADFCEFREGINCVVGFGKMNLWQLFYKCLVLLRAYAIFDSNRPVRKINCKTFRLYCRHGGSLKKCPMYTHALGAMDYILTLSDEMQKIDFKEVCGYCVNDLERVVPLGFPINDRIFEKVDLFENGFYRRHLGANSKLCYKNVVGWLPTFRQHRQRNRIDSKTVFPYGIPLIKSEDELMLLNDSLRNKDILLVIQMHHAQKENFSKKVFSNIVMISQEIKYEMNVSVADLMQSFDAMITDYSAVYHEYILLDRPIALSIDDFEDYASQTGFCFDYFDLVKGKYLKNTSDLLNFIDEVAKGIDSEKDGRRKSLSRIHKYVDNMSTRRVVDFIIEKARL